MDYRIIWTEPAIEELDAALAYIARDNPPAARAVGQRILREVELLKTFPKMGPPYLRGSDGEDRELLCGSYRIFYRILAEEAVIEVMSLWHSARENRPSLR